MKKEYGAYVTGTLDRLPQELEEQLGNIIALHEVESVDELKEKIAALPFFHGRWVRNHNSPVFAHTPIESFEFAMRIKEVGPRIIGVTFKRNEAGTPYLNDVKLKIAN